MSDGNEAAAGAPRNSKQVENLAAAKADKRKLSHDSIYNTLQLAFQLEGFVHQIDLYPSLTIVLGMKEAIEDFNNLLTIKQPDTLFMSVDTTFNCGFFFSLQ